MILSNFRHVLILVDLFSSYNCLIPLKDKKPKDIRDAYISTWESTFGSPIQLYSDNENAILAEFRQHLITKNVQIFTSFPRAQFENGAAEAAVKILKTKLRSLFNDFQLETPP